MSADTQPLLPPTVTRALGWGLIFVLLVIGSFNFPLMPAQDLDPSWRMALGYFSEKGMQFGQDVVFTYGPLGYIMGKTFSGVQFWELIIGQLTLAVISAVVLLRQGMRTHGSSRVLYLVFIIFFGVTYEDALHMLVIAILGYELLRLENRSRYVEGALAVAIMALYSQIKFTDLLLSAYILALASAYRLWLREWRVAAWQIGVYLVIYLGIWIGSGQNLANLPAYFQGSWQISQGYQWAMGFPTPFSPLWKALVIIAILAAYGVAHLWLNPAKPRAVANFLLLAAFVYLNWKHGFVRADGHMIGFFFCALLPITAYPHLLDDANRFPRVHRWVFIFAAFMSLWGTETALFGVVRQSMAIFQNRAWGHVEAVLNWQETRQRYRDNLSIARAASDLYQTREIIGKASVDVLGYEQGVAIFNRLNYRPRPVIQSYSTFMPYLARRNGDFFASDSAPEYALLKIQTIDGRLPVMDDPFVHATLAYRYEYLRTEKGFQLWKRSAQSYDAQAFAPKPLRDITLPINTTHNVEDISDAPMWVQIDVQPSLLGKIRSFLYKPTQVMISLQDTAGNVREYLMPLPQGRTGFIVNPIIEDVVDYMHFANDRMIKRLRTITLKVAPGEERYYAPSASVSFCRIPRTHSAKRFFTNINERLFHMFKVYPVSYESVTGFSEATIEGRDVAVMHAPSQMIFDLPADAKTLTGSYGFLPGTYTNGGATNGAEWVIYWTNGNERVDLFHKFLDPVKNPGDRGLQDFSCNLEGLKGGRLYFEVKPGPYNDHGWDWTSWTDVKIE